MREVVIVDSVRTGLAKSFRGKFNMTRPDDMAAHCVDALLARTGIDPASVEDCIVGAGSNEGAQGFNIGRNVAVLSRLGIGPVFSVPKLLKTKGLRIDDIDLWELNEAFASQCLYSRNRLEIDNARYNVNGGSISIGHPFGMTGSRQVGHLVRELQRRNLRYGIVTMCVGGGMGATGLFEAVR